MAGSASSKTKIAPCVLKEHQAKGDQILSVNSAHSALYQAA
jgi:hypothetical protein